MSQMNLGAFCLTGLLALSALAGCDQINLSGGGSDGTNAAVEAALASGDDAAATRPVPPPRPTPPRVSAS